MQSVSIVKFRDRAVVAFKATLIGITVGSPASTPPSARIGISFLPKASKASGASQTS